MRKKVESDSAPKKLVTSNVFFLTSAKEIIRGERSTTATHKRAEKKKMR